MAAKKAAPPGGLFECRVARLFNRQGSFVRRRVDLNRRFTPSRLTVTDLDLLVIDFGVDLRPTRTIVECKTGTSVRELDRMIWLSGLAKLTDAQRAALFMSGRASSKSRQVGRELDVLLQDEGDLTRREKSLGIDRMPEWGSHDPELLVREDEVRKASRTLGPDVERAYWFLRSEFWHIPPSLAVKRSIAAITALSRLNVRGVQADEGVALSWLIADAVTAFCVAAVELAGNALILPREDFERFMVERLAEGLASYAHLQRLSEVVDRLVVSTLNAAGVGHAETVGALGALAPRPPSYADALIEVIERLSERPRAARHLPLIVDYVFARTVRQPGELSGLRAFPVDSPGDALALARLCMAFLKGQAHLHAPLAGAFDTASEGTPTSTLFATEGGHPTDALPVLPSGGQQTEDDGATFQLS
ncbi:MAG: hypothetical protein E6J14_15215 [Chloroflexi bacterium]|nr:MAG: hypothetical protein E6J14_15215 [Chloroflexota bacterium]